MCDLTLLGSILIRCPDLPTTCTIRCPRQSFTIGSESRKQVLPSGLDQRPGNGAFGQWLSPQIDVDTRRHVHQKSTISAERRLKDTFSSGGNPGGGIVVNPDLPQLVYAPPCGREKKRARIRQPGDAANV